MMKRFIYLALGACAAFQVQAQGVFAYSELNRSAKATSMGGLSTAMDANAFSVFENASSVSFSDKKAEIGVQYGQWAKNLTKGMDSNNLLLDVAGYYRATDKSSLLFGVSYFAPGGNKTYAQDEEGNSTGEEIKSRYFSINLGYAHQFTEYWSAAVVANYANWDAGLKQRVGAFSVDASVTRRFDFSSMGNLDVTLKASNWGKMISGGPLKKGYELPGSVSLGALWGVKFADLHSVKVAAEAGYRCQDEKAMRASGGVEYGFHDWVFVRGGYYYTDYDTTNNSFASVGLGGCFKNARLDVSYLIAQPDSPLQNTFMVGASFAF